MPLSAQKPRLKKSPSIDPALLSQWDKQWIWHPFTQMAEWAQDDILIIASGKGSYLRDLKGRRYIDGVSSLWCNVHGHRVRELDQAVKNQLRKIAKRTS